MAEQTARVVSSFLPETGAGFIKLSVMLVRCSKTWEM